MNSDSAPSAHSSSPQQTTQWFQGKAWTTDENGWWIQATAQPWRCTLCGKDNTAKAKVCAQCNARRAWASRDTPSQPMTSAPVQSPAQTAPGMQTRQQLLQVNSRLTAMESDTSMEPSGNDKPVQEDRSQLSAHIKTLEAALATLPSTPQFAKHRGPLEEEILLAKKRIVLLKPVGARIDACRQALVRATKRQQEAQETMRLASATLEKANTEVSSLSSDLAELEATVASEPIAQTRENSLEQLRSGMEAVLTDMESSSCIGGDLISGARMSMQQLFTQLASVAEAALHSSYDNQSETIECQQPGKENSIRSLLTKNAAPSLKPASFREGGGNGES